MASNPFEVCSVLPSFSALPWKDLSKGRWSPHPSYLHLIPQGFSFSQNAATAGAATAGVKPRAKSPSHSGTPHKGHRASSPTADSSESIPVVSPQKRRRGNPEPSLCSRSAKGKGDQGLAQCLARENQLKQRLGGGLGEKLGGAWPHDGHTCLTC
eukprot:1158329-Pelagomonas_calceolata.AAC.11